MNFKEHSDLAGKHAFLSPSYYHWINYNDQKLEARLISWRAAMRGVSLHEFAHMAIKLGQKLPKSRKTLHMYVNDGIAYKMDVEVPLFYSPNCFGHADSVAFNNMFLRIHDLKTGIGRTSVHQLEIYAALFCLEYNYSPFEIEIELRIYQNDEIQVYHPHSEGIRRIMDTIIDFDLKIEFLRERGLV
jgi:hypothetical protein